LNTVAHAGDLADRRDVAERRVDDALDRLRREVARIRVGADGGGFQIERCEGRSVARAHVALEGAPALVEARALALARALRAERHAVDGGFLLVERLVDSLDLVFQHGVVALLAFERGETLVVRALERLERREEIMHGAADLRRHRRGRIPRLVFDTHTLLLLGLVTD